MIVMVPLISNTPLASPMYLIMGGGEGEGAIVTRDRKGPATHSQDTSLVGHLLFKAGKTPPGAGVKRLGNATYLAQTNWDEWLTTSEAECRARISSLPGAEQEACRRALWFRYHYNVTSQGCMGICKLYSDGRHEKAVSLLAPLTPEQMTPTQLMRVMSTPPVLNGITQFTAIMSPGAGHYSTILREHHHAEGVRLDPGTITTLRLMMQHFVEWLKPGDMYSYGDMVQPPQPAHNPK